MFLLDFILKVDTLTSMENSLPEFYYEQKPIYPSLP